MAVNGAEERESAKMRRRGVGKEAVAAAVDNIGVDPVTAAATTTPDGSCLMSSVFWALVFARIVAALTSNISDCDETYNYWEPVRYL